MRKSKSPPVEIRPGCQHCYNWREQTDPRDEVRWGECWRYPPTMVPSTDEDGTVVPIATPVSTQPDDLCGEFKAGDA